MLGLKNLFKSERSAEDERVLEAIRNAHESLRVIGRGTVEIDPTFVANSENFVKDLERAKKLVRG